MAKTKYPSNHFGMAFGYEVNTIVSAAEPLLNGEEPPVVIGTKVYPASISSIEANQLLEISGAGQITVSGIDSDETGDFFTFSEAVVPEPGSMIRTPWNTSGPFLVTRDNNTITLNYYNPTEHDLYFGTQKTADSGKITATLDGQALGLFNLYNSNTVPASVLLRENTAPGSHTLVVQAEITYPEIFVYFHQIELLEHNTETGGEYLYQGPTGILEDSSNNFVGNWASTPGYVWTVTAGASVFFYPQLDSGGSVKVRLQKTPDAAIIAVYINGAFRQEIDLYANPGLNPWETTLLDEATGDPAGLYEIELRHTGTTNPASNGSFFYFRSSVVVIDRTGNQALKLAADYLKQVAAIRGDGAFLDSWDSNLINFDANSLYACMGLLAAYEALNDDAYLDSVKNFLIWFASMQSTDETNPFNDGAWNIGYRVNPAVNPPYLAALGAYEAQGISEIKWVDAVQCLPAFVLWWYWKLSGDNATKDNLLPVFQKGIEGFLKHNYDPETGFYFSSWQNKTAPTIFLYQDAIRRYSAGGSLLEQHNDSEEAFFSYSGTWSSYAPQGAIGGDEHFTLSNQSYVQFSLTLLNGDQVRWITRSAWDTGIAEVLVSTNGTNYAPISAIDTFSETLQLQKEFILYNATADGIYWFRIRHSGTINEQGNTIPGWQRLTSRFSAGQCDVALGLMGLWLMTRKTRYAQLAARLIRRFPQRYWKAAGLRWFIALDGGGAGIGNDFWYPMTHGYTGFALGRSRFFQPKTLLSDGLQSLENDQNSEGGFQPPGYIEAEFIFSAFYLLGENQLMEKTSQAMFDLAKQHLKSGQYLMSLGGQPAGAITFSKRYQYLYTNISGFACLALAGTQNPIEEQLKFSESRMVTRQ